MILTEAQNRRLVVLISKIFELNNEEVNKKLKEILFEGNSPVKGYTKEDSSILTTMLENVGNVGGILKKLKSSEGSSPYSASPGKYNSPNRFNEDNLKRRKIGNN